MSDPLPPDLEPPNFEPPPPPPPWAAPGTAAAMEPAEPAPKDPAWKSWLAVGVVTAAFAGGAILAISLAGGSKDSSTSTPAAAAADPGTPSPQGPGGNGSGPALVTRRGVRGRIAAIDGTTLTLGSTDPSDESTVTVESTDATAFRETVEGTLADIEVGDNIVAMGTASDAGISAANIIDIGDDAAGTDFRAGGPPLHLDGDRRGPGAGGVTAGTVESIDGTTITVESVDGSTVIVATTADTAITVTKAITFADLAVGDTVSALGTADGSTVIADTVQKGEFAFGRAPIDFRGQGPN